jgi:hypothetical protein
MKIERFAVKVLALLSDKARIGLVPFGERKLVWVM